MADDNVVVLSVSTKLDIPPERVLKGALTASLDEVVVIGIDQDGEFYFASSQAHSGETLWHLERAKLALMKLGE